MATIGPASSSQKILEEMLIAGVNVIRMNFSHGDFAEHQPKADNARRFRKNGNSRGVDARSRRSKN